MTKVYTAEDENVVLYAGCVRDRNAEIKTNSSDCAVLDSGCSSNVCGKLWLDSYLNVRSRSQRLDIIVRIVGRSYLHLDVVHNKNPRGSILFQHLLQTDV